MRPGRSAAPGKNRLAGLSASAAGHRAFVRPAGDEHALPVVGCLCELGFALRLAGLRRRIRVRCRVLVDGGCSLIRNLPGLAGCEGLFGSCFRAGAHADLRDARMGQSVAPRAGRDARHVQYGPHSRAWTVIFSVRPFGLASGVRSLKGGRSRRRESAGRNSAPGNRIPGAEGHEPGWQGKSDRNARYGFNCPRISPFLSASLCTLTYRLPALKALYWSSVSLAPAGTTHSLSPFLVRGTATPPFCPGAAS